MSASASWTHTGYAQRLVFGPGSLARLPEVVKALGARRVLLLATPGRLASPAGERLTKLLGRTLASTFDGVRPHVPTTAAQAAVARAREVDADAVVSFGGGSAIDLAKAVCFFTEQQAGLPGTSYTDRPVLPHVAVPTTYSGAELTPFFGMTDEGAGRKAGAGGPTLAPVAALYDPELTLDTPPRVSAETGMNALAHGVEAAYSPARTPEAEAVALACVERVAAALPGVVDNPSDLAARTAMLAGAALGGRCLHNAAVGVHHGLAQLLGGRTGIPHGLANAVLLPHAVAFNAEAVPAEVARIARALAPGAADADAAGAIDRLRRRLGLPGRLSEVGVAEDDLDAVARLSQSSPTVAANPRPVTEADARAILTAAF